MTRLLVCRVRDGSGGAVPRIRTLRGSGGPVCLQRSRPPHLIPIRIGTVPFAPPIVSPTLVCLTAIAIGGLLGACQPTPDNSNDNSIPIALGETGQLDLTATDRVRNSGIFDITADLPQETPIGAALVLDPADIAVGTAADANTNAASATLIVQLAAADVADVCSVGLLLNPFTISVSDAGAISVTPTTIDVGTAGLDVLLAGRFAACLNAYGNLGRPLDISTLGVVFSQPTTASVSDCADVLALPEVQAALDTLNSNGITSNGISPLPIGNSLPDLTGSFVLRQLVTFDPDGTDDGNSSGFAVTLRDQTDTTIIRADVQGSVAQFLQGNAAKVAFCTLARTNQSECDQTIARLESLNVGLDTADLVGRFLAVVIRRHAYTGPCGAVGDFIYGDLALTRPPADPPVARRGKLTLDDGFVPDLLIVPPDDGPATVTDQASAAAVHFTTAATPSAQTIALPTGLEPAGSSALGLSRDGALLAVVTDQPDTAVIYDNATLDVVRANAATTLDFLGGRIDFAADASRVYLPTVDGSVTRITVMRAGETTGSDIALRLIIAQAKIPLQARISPDGEQMAVLLESETEPNLADALLWMKPDAEATRSPINLVTEGGGTVLGNELIYSPNGSLVFLAGVGAVLAVQTTSPYTVTRIDVSNGAGDDPVALALSNDGEVLAVAVDDKSGSVDFAVVDVATLEAVYTTDLPGIDKRGALAVAHFGAARVALVANLDATVVAVQTEDPYSVGRPLSAADQSDRITLGAMSAGQNVVAVTNLDEPAVYLFELPPTP